MKNKKVLFFTILSVVFCITFMQCKDEYVENAADPEILSFSFDYENTNLVNLEVI